MSKNRMTLDKLFEVVKDATDWENPHLLDLFVTAFDMLKDEYTICVRESPCDEDEKQLTCIINFIAKLKQFKNALD